MSGTARNRFIRAFFAAILLVVTGLVSSRVTAQTPELRDVQNQFIPEEGCPVRIVKAETRMEVDSFGAPLACRIYIDYTNSGSRPINAVKFKIGYVDREDKVRGSFHAPDGHELSPGAQASAKWRGEKIDPRTRVVKIRVLLARYADGSMWESEKMKDIVKPDDGSGSSNDDEPSASGQQAPSNASAPQARNSDGL